MRPLLLLVLAATACQQAAVDRPPMTRSKIEFGQQLAGKHCSGCHATGRSGPSPHPDAPVFRELGTIYRPEALSESLVEGIMTGHPDMPVFVFGADDADALVAYLTNLQGADQP
jgi:cytochrome c